MKRDIKKESMEAEIITQARGSWQRLLAAEFISSGYFIFDHYVEFLLVNTGRPRKRRYLNSYHAFFSRLADRGIVSRVGCSFSGTAAYVLVPRP